jgi:hypothetical protein
MAINSLHEVRIQLCIELYACLLLSVLFVVLFENELLLPGGWADETSRQFVIQSVMEIVSVAVIPAALYMFRVKKVEDDLRRRGVRALASWGSLRVLLIGTPMLVNTILYYLFMSVAFGYMAIILLLCVLFIYPSKERCRQETFTAVEDS